MLTKFLVFYGGGIGDFFIVAPLCMALKHQYPTCEIVLLTCSDKRKIKSLRLLLKCQKTISRIEYYTKSEPFHDLGLVFRLSFEHFRYAFICDYHFKDSSIFPSLIADLCHIKSVGCKPLNPKIHYSIYSGTNDYGSVRKYQYCLSLANAVGIPTDSFDEQFLDSRSLQSFLPPSISLPKKYVVLVAGTGPVSMKIPKKFLGTLRKTLFTSFPKRWPISRWISLSNKIVEKYPGYSVVLLGDKGDAVALSGFTLAEGVLNLCGKIDINASLFVLSRSRLVVGCDTGLMQAAGILGKKTITLFGCTDPIQYLPYGNSDFVSARLNCSPCFSTMEAVNCKTHACMYSISVDCVLDRIRQNLKDD
jgi:ADP-heptose:LPS heptosyltransferase